MIDAYEIGIRLALENGVSEGIAEIRRDLAALDAAVARSAAGLVSFRDLAVGLARPAPPPVQPLQSKPAPLTAPPGEPEDRTSPRPEAIAVPPATEPNAAPVRTELSRPPIQESFPRRELPVEPVRQILTPRADRADEQFPRQSVSSFEAPSAPRPNETVPAVDPRPAPTLAKQPPVSDGPASTAPVPKPSAPGGGAISVQAPAQRQAPALTEPRSARVPPPVTPPAASPILPGKSRPTVHHSTQLTSTTPRVGAAASSRPAPVSLAPIEIEPFAAAPPRTPGASLAPRRGAISPAPDRHDENDAIPQPPRTAASRQPSGGQIIMDGHALGRWLSERLNRAVDRPVSGTTGFDPRVGLAWPGPANGS